MCKKGLIEEIICLLLIFLFMGYCYSKTLLPINSRENIRAILGTVHTYENEFDRFLRTKELSKYATKETVNLLKENYPTKDYSNVDDKASVSNNSSIVKVMYIRDNYIRYDVEEYNDKESITKSYITTYKYNIFGKIKSFKECEVEENLDK